MYPGQLDWNLDLEKADYNATSCKRAYIGTSLQDRSRAILGDVNHYVTHNHYYYCCGNSLSTASCRNQEGEQRHKLDLTDMLDGSRSASYTNMTDPIESLARGEATMHSSGECRPSSPYRGSGSKMSNILRLPLREKFSHTTDTVESTLQAITAGLSRLNIRQDQDSIHGDLNLSTDAGSIIPESSSVANDVLHTLRKEQEDGRAVLLVTSMSVVLLPLSFLANLSSMSQDVTYMYTTDTNIKYAVVTVLATGCLITMSSVVGQVTHWSSRRSRLRDRSKTVKADANQRMIP